MSTKVKYVLSTLVFTGLLIVITNAANTYVITIPNQIQPGVPLGMTINILKASGDVTVLSKLTNAAGTEFSNSTRIFSPGDSGNLTLQIPTENLSSDNYFVEISGSGGLVFQNKARVQFNSNGAFALIQTDRVYFTLGETVKLRVLSMHPNLRPYDGKFDVQIYDSGSTLVFQWLGVSGHFGVWEKEFVIGSSMRRGKWLINVNVQGKTSTQEIIVRQIVIPKFNVTIDSPVSFTSPFTTYTVTVHARYSFDQPVYGTIMLQILSSASERVLTYKTGNINGSASYIFSYPSEDIVIVAQVGESKSGVTVTSSLDVAYVQSTSGINDFTYVTKPDKFSFRPGLPFVTYVVLPKSMSTSAARNIHVKFVIKTLEEKTCTLQYPNYQYKIERMETVVLNNVSIVEHNALRLQLPVPNYSDKMDLQVLYNGTTQYTATFYAGHSPSSTFLNVLPDSAELTVGQKFTFRVAASASLKGNLIVQIIARGIQVFSNKYPASIDTISIYVAESFYPKISVLVYNVLPSGEIISDEFHVDVKGRPTENELSIQCVNCNSSVTPNSDISLNIRASPNSEVYLLGVDDKINFVQTGYDVSLTDVLQNVNSYSGSISADVSGNWFRKRSKLRFKRFDSNAHDTNDMFEVAGMNVLTDAKIYDYDMREQYRVDNLLTYCTDMPFYPAQTYPPPLPYPGGTYLPNYTPNPQMPNPLGFHNQRKHFPKTWIWETCYVGPNGVTTMSKQLPGSVTTWTLTAFSTSYDHGFGITANPIKIKTFLEVFVDVEIPKFVITDNWVVVKVIIYNYKPRRERISIEVQRDDDPNYWETRIKQVLPNQQEVVTLSMSFKTVGKTNITVSAFYYRERSPFDVVQKPIEVKAPGVQKEYNIPTLIGLSGGTHNYIKNIDLQYESDTVHGSKKIYATVTGDILAPSIQGLDNLIRMPTGCGEQTMLSLAPDIFILKYLKSTNQLSPDIRNKAIEYMLSGKKRELSYQRTDGSFSAFGNRDTSGSTWLTAFVLLSFREAQEFITIENRVLQRAVDWLLAHQNSDGSFTESGRIIHYQMQGGSNTNKVTMTSFVSMALLENENLENYQQRILHASQRAKAFMEQQRTSLTDIYALAVTAYALRRVNSGHAQFVYDKLLTHAISNGTKRHWETHRRRKRTANLNWVSPNPRARPIDIETTAYALLFHVLKNDLDGAMSIVNWLTSQRNPDGGFSSTQDTVVALRALSEFASLLSRNQTTHSNDVHVSINYDGYINDLYVSNTNKHLLQQVKLRGDPSRVQIISKGNGVAIVDVVVRYNVPAKMNGPVFDITSNVTNESFDTITVHVCVRRLNHDNNGMVITEVGLPSGYTADLNNIGAVSGLKRKESEIDKIILYFDTITTSGICFDMKADRIDRATQSQSIPVIAYDYYEPENQGMTNYTSGLLKNMKICDLCQSCSICDSIAVG